MTIAEYTNSDYYPRVVVRTYLKRGSRVFSSVKRHLTMQGISEQVLEDMIKDGQLEKVRDAKDNSRVYLTREKGGNPLYATITADVFDFQVLNRSERITGEQLLEVICRYYSVSEIDVQSKKRDRIFVIPRHVFCYLSYHKLKMPLKDAGKYIGGKDHSTVIHGRDAISDLLDTDNGFKKDFIKLETYINSKL